MRRARTDRAVSNSAGMGRVGHHVSIGIASFFAVALPGSQCAFAQAAAPIEPVAVSPCELVQAPENFNGRRVRVRAGVNLAFESFSLDLDECGFDDSIRGVWLEYGGDQETATVYCCGDHSKRPGLPTEVAGHRVELVRDAALDLFIGRLDARRLRQPGGERCWDRSCHFYDVTATITGRFAAAPAGEEQQLGGYGHLGCCHQLTIEQVSDVSAARTMVPAGGTYRCERQSLAPSRALVQELNDIDIRACVGGRGMCDAKYEQWFSAIGRHWDDAVDVRERAAPRWLTVEGPRQSAVWTSADLRLTYRLTLPYPFPPADAVSHVGIERTRCEPVTPPASSLSPVTCTRRTYDPFFPGAALQAGLAARGAAADVARRLLDAAAGQMKISLPGDLPLECYDASAAGFVVHSCEGVSADALTAALIVIDKPGPDPEVPWGVVRAEAMSCAVQSDPR